VENAAQSAAPGVVWMAYARGRPADVVSSPFEQGPDVLNSSFEDTLVQLAAHGESGLLSGGLIGLEKESLRVTADGHISQRKHPPALGSALTHPYITTDYSEALLEFITPPYSDLTRCVDDLRELQAYAARRIGDELLWATSMPCILDGETQIPIAEYGHSNAGIMKHVYRRGLGHRYGRTMQVIAGVHFNYSVNEALWPVLQRIHADHRAAQAFATDAYFGMIRNLQRCGWMIPYLFGASPAVCKSFFGDQAADLEDFDDDTYYLPHATSLRVSDIGYQNKKEKKGGLQICYDSLDQYVEWLTWAIETPHPEYEALGIVVDGRYEQLNGNMLQIENEYYSSIRPKQIAGPDEKPSLALKRRGVRYVELRSLDVCAFESVGVNEPQLRFLEAYLLYCLLQPSAPIDAAERTRIDRNLDTVARRGREPGLKLERGELSVALNSWAGEILEGVAVVAELLDTERGGTAARSAVASQQAKLAEPDQTPSARVLREMMDREEGFFEYAMRLAQRHREDWLAQTIAPERVAALDREAEASRDRQAEMEARDEPPFAEYLARYFAQRWGA
jgi:glutamate--cysteine ligase